MNEYDLIKEGIEAIRLTREYVGEKMLPNIEGWSHFDWAEKAKAHISNAPTHIYCQSCDTATEYFVEPLTTDALNDVPWGDIVCKKCDYVIATFSSSVAIEAGAKG